MLRKSWTQWNNCWLRQECNSIRQFWWVFVQEWRRDPITISFELLGTVTSMLAAVLLSLQLVSLITVYWIWCLGSISLSISSKRRRNSLLFGLMMFYTVLNVIGIWNLL